MKALAIQDRFGAENLRWVERAAPRPGPGMALVRIRAVSLNFRDLQIVDGVRAVPLPLIPFSDGAGEVVELGAGVTRVRVGDRVMPTFAQGWISGPAPLIDPLPTLGGPLDGVCVEFAAFHEDFLVHTPAHLSDVEAATFPCAAVSAWNALFGSASVRPGDVVLLEGTGGVSLFALLFAKAAGARIIITSGSDDKLARARALGADETINYRTRPDWGALAHQMAGRGVDCVVEIGGEATMAQALAALRNGGRLSYVGFVSGATPRFDLAEISRKSITVAGVRVGHRDSFEDMLRAIAHLKLRPVIDAEFSATEAGAALARLRSGKHMGKICLRMPSS